MVIYLARHTQSEYNVKRRLNSDPKVNVRLSKKGIKQAHQLAEKLKDADFKVIFTSEFPRTRHTADIINTEHNAEIIIDTRVNEIDTGFDGQNILKFWWALSGTVDREHQRFNDGESFADVRNRAAAFLNDLKKYGYSSVLIVTHSTLIGTIYEILSGTPFEEARKYKIPQGSYAKFEL
jgi:broad specificity phosphatase PhoE